MGVVTKFPEIVPFNSMKAFEREREYSLKLEKQLAKALMLLGMECDRRQMRGENVEHIRAFVREASA